MKIELVGHTLTVRDKDTKKRVTYEPGKPFDIDDKEAEHLIAQGFAKKADGKQEETRAEKAAREAAEKRAALEEKATTLKIGTAEEIKALSDADLKARVEQVGGK